ncbi:GNAT family protein [Apiospora saccharicola]|uniref:GNAT family protein n=1 Tax=Apiospora saccharicola TaxID=335842 RepID=A0ABR1W2X7_9PEZI
MAFVVLPALIPEIAEVYDVYFAAFKDEPILEYYYPNGINHNEHRQRVLDGWNLDPDSYTLKCVEPATGHIVGMAVFEVQWRKGSSRPRGASESLEGWERQRLQTVLDALNNKREELMGERKHVYCQTMAVLPDYQRKGVGALLMSWGIDAAERLDLPIYVESTLPGRHFYRAMGFETPTYVIHKGEDVGREKDDIVPIMVKMPIKYEGLSVEDWHVMVDEEV